ncbi:hypothetical protein OG21DRAFT_373531 [Imleria badia]|nr:hypothetical protein OG21DRAFT_373531 [Imleria badia]
MTDFSVQLESDIPSRLRKVSWVKWPGIYIEFSVNGVMKAIAMKDTNGPLFSNAREALSFDANDASIMSVHVYAKRFLRTSMLIGVFQGRVGELLSQNDENNGPSSFSFRILVPDPHKPMSPHKAPFIYPRRDIARGASSTSSGALAPPTQNPDTLTARAQLCRDLVFQT